MYPRTLLFIYIGEEYISWSFSNFARAFKDGTLNNKMNNAENAFFKLQLSIIRWEIHPNISESSGVFLSNTPERLKILRCKKYSCT